MTVTGVIKPGDVLCTRSGGLRSAGWWIRLSAALRDAPNLSNHICVISHTDGSGTVWGIEGRPSGAGWADCKTYLADKHTLTNSAQPLTGEQRAAITAQMKALLATEYDWASIAADGLATFGVKLPGWDSRWPDGQVNVQAVCSSLAALAYARAGVPHPPGDRGCTPDSWVSFILNREWEVPSTSGP